MVYRERRKVGRYIYNICYSLSIERFHNCVCFIVCFSYYSIAAGATPAPTVIIRICAVAARFFPHTAGFFLSNVVEDDVAAVSAMGGSAQPDAL